MKWFADIIFVLGIAVLVIMIVMALAMQHISQGNLILMCLLAMLLFQIYARRKEQSGNQEAQHVTESSAGFETLPPALFILAILALMFTELTAYSDNRRKEQCSDSAQSDVAIPACTTLIHSGLTTAAVFTKRATAYNMKGRYDLSIADADRALLLDPNYAAAFRVRGVTFFELGQYGNAIRDFDQSLSLKPYISDIVDVNILLMRGVAKFYAISPQSAIADLATASRVDSADPLKAIWLHLARIRAGEDDQEFQHNSTLVLTDRWPAPILSLYRGKTTVEEVFLRAKIDDVTHDRICEANFYSAEFYLLQNKKDKAKPLFQAAQDSCPIISMERNIARTELMTKRIKTP